MISLPPPSSSSSSYFVLHAFASTVYIVYLVQPSTRNSILRDIFSIWLSLIEKSHLCQRVYLLVYKSLFLFTVHYSLCIIKATGRCMHVHVYTCSQHKLTSRSRGAKKCLTCQTVWVVKFSNSTKVFKGEIISFRPHTPRMSKYDGQHLTTA